jgi:hypothetical protein
MTKGKLSRRPREFNEDLVQLNLGKRPKSTHDAIRAFADAQRNAVRIKKSKTK